MHANIAASFRASKASPSSNMLRKKVKSDAVEEMMVLDVTLVSASEALKAN